MDLFYSTANLQFIKNIKYPEISIKEGKFTFITGPSGAGKSSFLKLLNRTELPLSGEIFYQQKNILEYDVINYRKEVLLVPQDVYLIEGNIKQNFDFYYEMREENPITDEEIKFFTNLCNIDFDLTTDCEKLSGGERERIFISIFLSFAKKVFIMDEPTAALDEETSFSIFKKIKSYAKEKNLSVIVVSHNDELVKHFGDEIIRID